MLYLQIDNNSHQGNFFVKKVRDAHQFVFKQTMKAMPVKPRLIGSTGICCPA